LFLLWCRRWRGLNDHHLPYCWTVAREGAASRGRVANAVPQLIAGRLLHIGGLTFLTMAAGAAWTIANPGRGPHDRIAGTWVVPR
jgi:hypothetical protein